MGLTKGQKKRRNRLVAEAKEVRDPKRATELWQLDDKYAIVLHVRSALLQNPHVWQVIKPLFEKNGHPHAPAVLLHNHALTDEELVRFGVVDVEPLAVLKHPGCGDMTLKRVAEMWHNPPRRGMDMDCVPRWATQEQIERMYQLYPPCKDQNETIGYAQFCQRIFDRLES